MNSSQSTSQNAKGKATTALISNWSNDADEYTTQEFNEILKGKRNFITLNIYRGVLKHLMGTCITLKKEAENKRAFLNYFSIFAIRC